MKIEKLRSNKIKVTFSQEDMLIHGLTPELVAKNAPAAREVFWEVLRQAEAETGFSAEDGKLMIEAMPGADDSLVLYITRLEQDEALPFRKKVRLKIKNAEEGNCLMFSSFDDIVDMARAMPDLNGGTLYFYKEKYYLVMPSDTLELLSEFGKKTSAPYIASILSEHGKLICENAMETIREYF